MRRIILLSMILGALLAVSGCGGGGGGTPAPQPTTMTVTLSTSGTLPSGNLIRGIDVTLNLPTGVTVTASPSTVNPSILVPDSSVVGLLGGAAGADKSGITYSAGKVNLIVLIPNGISTGSDFATVNCIVPPGSSFSASNFTITPHTTPTGVYDVNTSLPGVNVVIK